MNPRFGTSLAGVVLGQEPVAGRLLMPPEMHGQCERAMTVGAGEGLTSVMLLLCPGFELRMPEHATYHLDSICRDSPSSNARQANLLTFLSRKLRRELDAHVVNS